MVLVFHALLQDISKAENCSTRDFPALNPSCSSRSLRSTAFLSLCRSVLDSTLPGTESRVIPRQLLRSDTSLFFGSFTIVPYCDSFGTSPFGQQSSSCRHALSPMFKHFPCYLIHTSCLAVP